MEPPTVDIEVPMRELLRMYVGFEWMEKRQRGWGKQARYNRKECRHLRARLPFLLSDADQDGRDTINLHVTPVTGRYWFAALHWAGLHELTRPIEYYAEQAIANDLVRT